MLKSTRDMVYLFSHGFGDSGKQGNKYVNKYGTRENQRYVIYQPMTAFNYPDVIFGRGFNLSQTSLGQKNETAALNRNYCLLKEKEIVLYGVSRGAAAAINFAAEYKPNLKAIVVESPFDFVDTVFDEHWIVKNSSKIPFVTKKFILKMFKRISKYEDKGLQPINLVDQIDSNIPIIFVCSKTDEMIPFHSTVKLYKKLIETGHQNAHLLILDTGYHAKLLRHPDNEDFQSVVHAFYQHYDLPHNPDFAERGQNKFAQCKPTIADLDKS